MKKNLVIINNEKISKKDDNFYCDNFEAKISGDFKKTFNVTVIARKSKINRASQINLEKIEIALEEIRPFLKNDGGDITLVEVKNKTVKVRLEGACSKCRVNQMTLKAGVEMTIKKHAPEIEKVVNIGL